MSVETCAFRYGWYFKHATTLAEWCGRPRARRPWHEKHSSGRFEYHPAPYSSTYARLEIMYTFWTMHLTKGLLIAAAYAIAEQAAGIIKSNHLKSP